jgi:hypothetical protein
MAVAAKAIVIQNQTDIDLFQPGPSNSRANEL